MAPGQETSLAPSVFEPKVFESKFTVLKKLLATLLGFSAPRIVSEYCVPLVPLYNP